MDLPFSQLAQITVSYNDKGQFVFDITGSCPGTKELAKSVVLFAKTKLGDKIQVSEHSDAQLN